VTAEPGPGDSNWYFAKLQVVDAATGLARVVYKPKLQIAIPRWAPDGKRIALLEGLMSDEGAHGGDVMLVEAAGGAARNLTPGRGSSPSWLAWAGDSKILFTEFAGGGSVVSELDSATGAAKALYQGQERLTAGAWRPSFAASRDGSVSAMVRESLTSAPEVWMGATGAWKEATSLNKEVRPLWGKSESIEWRSGEWKVQGWLLHPAEKPKGKAPLVVLVHGGPAYLASSEWPSEWPVEAVLSARGAYVLMPNPRGSTGRGEKFKQANVKDFGGGDFRDIMAGVDSVLKREPVDGGRLGITGWSYGGYMTMWAVTQTTRFKAAAAVAGIANWQSYYGQNLIDQWMLPFFGASVYDDPAVYAKSSPITFIKRVKTPTVVMVGERDAECPAPQSFEFWHALDALGVPTRLVVYPGEGHSFAAAENRRGVLVETIEWLERYLR
jgi:dipeptidyl aminopeptidase/acylaminoacyl peptidase